MTRDTDRGDRIRFGLVGCGRISQTHLQALEALPDCELVAVADARDAAACQVAEQYRCRYYDSVEQILESESLDAAVICTPPSTHSKIAEALLHQGVHVLCEKPLAVTVAEAERMVAMANLKGLVLMMASKFRYVEEVISAKSIVQSGILGEIIQFENTFCNKVDMRGRWNADPVISGGGVLIDNGSHSVDIARYLLGPIDQIQAEEGKRIQGLEVEDTVRLYFRTVSDVLGSIDLSWTIHKEKESYLDLFGTEGVLSVGWSCARYRQSETMEWVKFGNGYDKLAAFGRQLRNFVGTIRGTDTPLITADDALASVRVIEAAYKSVEIDKWMRVAHKRVPDQTLAVG